MSSFTNYLEAALLNHVFRAVALSAPAAVYVGLFTSAPGEAGGGTEVSGGSYARQAITFGAPSGGTVTQSGAVQFPLASASWGTVVAYGIFDAVSGGNLLAWAAVTPNLLVDSGQQAQLADGVVTISLD